MMFWITTFPFDVIKSTIQTDSTVIAERKYRGILDVTKKIYAKEGFGGFWKGLAPCMIRSFPANAVCFLLYEMAKKQLG
jgi:solute carrier family 25 carnitine/acylcarnitine transporter 20/29